MFLLSYHQTDFSPCIKFVFVFVLFFFKIIKGTDNFGVLIIHSIFALEKFTLLFITLVGTYSSHISLLPQISLVSSVPKE